MADCPYKLLAHNFAKHSQVCAVYSMAAMEFDTIAQKNELCNCGYNKAKENAYAFICGRDHSSSTCSVDGCESRIVRENDKGKHKVRGSKCSR